MHGRVSSSIQADTASQASRRIAGVTFVSVQRDSGSERWLTRDSQLTAPQLAAQTILEQTSPQNTKATQPAAIEQQAATGIPRLDTTARRYEQEVEISPPSSPETYAVDTPSRYAYILKDVVAVHSIPTQMFAIVRQLTSRITGGTRTIQHSTHYR